VTPSPQIWNKNDFGNSDRCKREYRMPAQFVVAGLGERRRNPATQR
jgi:hypothetical protein